MKRNEIIISLKNGFIWDVSFNCKSPVKVTIRDYDAVGSVPSSSVSYDGEGSPYVVYDYENVRVKIND